MISVLKDIENNYLKGDEVISFKNILMDRADCWNTLDVTYHPPHVERLWRQHGEFRVFLHRIWPCERSESLWHPHDWPSAIKIVSGRYEHGLAIQKPDSDELVPVSVAELAEGSYYAMTGPRAWHYVRPLDGPVHTLMVTGKPYPKEDRVPFAKPEKPQNPLTDITRDSILKFFRYRFCGIT